MNIVDRVKNTYLTSTTEWPVIATDPATAGSLITGYVVPLAATEALSGFVGGSVIGRTLPIIGTYRTSLATGLGFACFTFVMAIGRRVRPLAHHQRAGAELRRPERQHAGAQSRQSLPVASTAGCPNVCSM